MESQQPLIPGIDALALLGRGPQEIELVHLFDKFRAVQAFVFDVDGVFTNNEMLVTEAGELLRSVSVRDGQALKWAIQAGFQVAIITGGRSEGLKKRFLDLGVSEYYSGIADKWPAFQSFMQRTGLNALQVCYMGDDLPDLPVLRKVMLSCAPADATTEVLQTVDYVSPLAGGRGCVRDVLEKTLKIQQKWPEY